MRSVGLPRDSYEQLAGVERTISLPSTVRIDAAGVDVGAVEIQVDVDLVAGPLGAVAGGVGDDPEDDRHALGRGRGRREATGWRCRRQRHRRERGQDEREQRGEEADAREPCASVHRVRTFP